MSRITPSAAARADLQQIADLLNGTRPASAGRDLEGLERACETLGRYPNLGMARPELGQHVRSTVVDHYIIIYRVVGTREDRVAEVIRFLHERQDVISAFGTNTIRERRDPNTDLWAINSRAEITNLESDHVIALQQWPTAG